LKIPELISVLYVSELYVSSGVIFSDALSSPVAGVVVPSVKVTSAYGAAGILINKGIE